MSDPSSELRVLSGLSEVADDFAAAMCDVWGVIHNGVAAYQEACEALARFRSGGGRVVLITNAPRPSEAVYRQLDGFGVDRASYDALVTSGDVTRDLLAADSGAMVLHIGPERDLSLYDDLDLTLTDDESAGLISCTGLFDDTTESPDDYDERLRDWAARDLLMVCANADIIVERGGDLVWCAGALAQRYEQLGGRTRIVGKPHAPIYEAALAKLSDQPPPPPEKILAIGDGVATDMLGAQRQGFRTLFVAGGIHAGEFGDDDATLDPSAVAAFLTRHGIEAGACMARLVW